MIDLLGSNAVPPAFFVWIAALVAAIGSRRVGTAAGVVACGLVVGWTLTVPSTVDASWTFVGFEIVPVAVDPAARVVALGFAGFGALGVGYLYTTGGDRLELTAALAYISAAIWSTFVGDWLGLLVGWEAMALASTVLVWAHGGAAVRAGYRYALVHALGGVLLAAGIAGHLVAVGGDSGALLYDGGIATGLPAVFVGAGIAVNAAVFGVHIWLPETYSRPHIGASVVLSAYTTKLACYVAYRAFPDGNLLLAYVGGLMTILGAGYALAQKDARRLLAYHIQAQIGYILAGIGVGSALGVAGGFAHLLNNILFKGLLFMVAGLITYRSATGRLPKADRIGRRTPILLGTFLVAAASITAVPGTNGFVSKGMVLDAAVEGGHEPLRWLLFAGAVGTVASFCKFGYYAITYGDESAVDAKSAQAATMVPIAVACIVLGLWYDPLFELLPASEAWSTDPYSTSHLIEASLLLGAGGVAFLVGRPLLARLDGGRDIDTLRDPAVLYGMRWLIGAVVAVFGAVRGVDRTVAHRIEWIVTHPVEVIAGQLSASAAEGYRETAHTVAGTLGISPGVWYRLFVLAACLLFALTVSLLGIGATPLAVAAVDCGVGR